ncbi:MAG: indolepyruvate ferredoxin oxidoreductase family protein [Burkholderiales bacterium]|nr:indolepyruvate ferredoxin oxidoreductase family protein [Burkholderiales bacterium]
MQTKTPDAAPTLEDRFTRAQGRVLLSGNQALVRLTLMQRQRDVALGLNTAGFVSGYRGSPLARIDREFEKVRPLLDAHHVVVRPGVNEDLAATAVWGSQQLGLHPGARYDGVFAMWYGKGPGVDRSMDAIRHAQACGTDPNGGVLLLVGDDHGAVSSTLPHQSEHNLASAMVPLLSPGGVGEFLDYGLLGWAMSRFSGAWIGFKCQTDIVEGTASVDIDPLRPRIVLPAMEGPAGGLGIRWPDGPHAMERRLEHKMQAVKAFARANGIDRIAMGAGPARVGVMASGKAWLDLLGALALLGIDEARASALGLRVYKVGLVWPVEPEGLAAFVHGLDTVLVVEEKRGVIEEQVKSLLFNRPAGERPSIVGKEDLDGRPLLPSWGEIGPVPVARALLRVLGDADPQLAARAAALDVQERARPAPVDAVREAYFCAGCPHSVSTRLPEGSRASTGIGCHMMVIGLPERATSTFTQMGGEGVAWTGIAPFTDEGHLFVNMGDGTYFHSGLLAIRAAVAAKVNATYKILFNDAVAMTGGQRHDGELTVPALVRQLQAEGLERVEVVAEDPDRWFGLLPQDVTLSHRDELDAVQRRLREIPGVTAIVYDQLCAAEKRRRRKRGALEAPPRRAFINDLVCEGCGDCSAVSNCIAVEPVDTPLGRKRQVNQSNCNTDLSCIKGFCPSFVTVEGVVPRRAGPGTPKVDPAQVAEGIPEPVLPVLDRPHAMLLAGIGGTGVITVSAILAEAAALDGNAVVALDQTGLAQKNGAVLSHVRIARDPRALASPRIGPGEADVILAFDLVTAAGATAVAAAAPGRTRAVVDRHVVPTAAFVKNNAVDLRAEGLLRTLRRAVDGEPAGLDATGLAADLLGDAIGANMMLLGYAWQAGLVPVSLASLDTAIALNGVAVGMNRAAFALGRLAAHDSASPRLRRTSDIAAAAEETAAQRQARREAFLAAYQDAAYAARFAALVRRAAEAEAALAPGRTAFAEAVSAGAFKLMAYKDEYEVARLYADGSFRAKLDATFEGDAAIRVHLAPPLLSRIDPRTGHPGKIAFGPWILTAFRLLAPLKRLRGTRFDPFGRTAERRMERAMIEDYAALVDRLCGGLGPDNHATAVALAELPLDIRGFGHVKLAAVAAATAKRDALLATWRDADAAAAPPARAVRSGGS